MANIVDPDQTTPSNAVSSESALFAYAILSDVQNFRTFTVENSGSKSQQNVDQP